LLLDNTRAQAIKAGAIPRADQTEEERIAEQIHKLRESGVPVQIFGLPAPDIICALPRQAVKTVVREHGGDAESVPDWDTVIERHARLRESTDSPAGKAPDFKTFALSELGMTGLTADDFVRAAVAAVQDLPQQDGMAARVVSEIVASAEHRR
jgi:hypothetical protein